MPNTLTARDRYHLKKYGSVDSPVRLAIRNGGTVAEHRDAIKSYLPKDKFEPIPISQEHQFNLKHFGEFNRPEQRQQTIQQPIVESIQSKKLAEQKITTREKLEKFAEQQRIDKERELKVAPYAAMGLVGTLTGTLPAMIAGEVGGRIVDYGSRKLTGKSWGENVLPEAPMIGELTNPGYFIGGIKPLYNSIKRELTTDKLYHFSGNENLQFNDIDLFRPGTSQMKKRYANLPDEMKPGGFYTNKAAGKSFMGGNYGYEMRIPKKSNVLDLNSQGRITDRIPIGELRKYADEGYDIIRGKNMIGEEEFIPLNKNIISDFKLNKNLNKVESRIR